MFENGEATDVVNENHKGSSTEASKSADKAVCLDVVLLKVRATPRDMALAG